MAKERFANTLPFCGVKDGHDALVVAIHTFMIETGYKCIGIGEQVWLVNVYKRWFYVNWRGCHFSNWNCRSEIDTVLFIDPECRYNLR